MSDAIPFVSRKISTLVDGTLRIVVDVDPPHRAAAFSLFAEPGTNGAMAALKDGYGLVEDEDNSYGKWWHQMISGNRFHPQMCQHIDTDAKFEDWIRQQPSCIDGDYDYSEQYPEGRCEIAHVRRAGPSGTAHRPPYNGVPMTHAQHSLQHQQGELAVLVKWDVLRSKEDQTVDQAKKWFDSKAFQYRSEWASKTLCRQLGHESRKDCPPAKVLDWAKEMGIMNYIPDRLRQP